jgi:hypothetical protein
MRARHLDCYLSGRARRAASPTGNGAIRDGAVLHFGAVSWAAQVAGASHDKEAEMADRWKGVRGIAAGAAALATALGGTAMEVTAQEQKPAAETQPAASEAPKGPNTGRLSISAGVDWTSAYFFRGIKQETEDLILQPYGELGIKVVDQAGALTSLTVTGGIWNSLQTGPTSDPPLASDPEIWYEFDGYVRLSAVLWEDLTAYALYTAYTSPSGAFNTVQEIAFGFGYNDAKFMGPFALNPTFLIAFEIDGQADAGADKGVYAQIGIAPGYTFLAESPYPITVSVPLSVGLSLSDYYEFGTGSDDTFGYFSGGVTVAVPLAFIPPDFGKWLVKAGVTVLYLSDNLKAINDGDRVQAIGTVGLAFSY